MDVIPLFKSHYSIGRSILTLEEEDEGPLHPTSIISIAKKNNLNTLYLVEDNMSSFLEAYTNTKKSNINLRYGLRVTITDNSEEKTEESRAKNSKFIIFFKNEVGYKDLIKLFSTAAKSGFYYEPRLDFKTLKSVWNNANLLLAVPFYDSFIFNNVLRNSLCTPDIDFCSPIFFLEDNQMPFDKLIKSKVIEYCEKNGNEIIDTKSIFYELKKDFKAYLTFRCINQRTTLNKPEINHMSSDSFCFESWKEKNG